VDLDREVRRGVDPLDEQREDRPVTGEPEGGQAQRTQGVLGDHVADPLPSPRAVSDDGLGVGDDGLADGLAVRELEVMRRQATAAPELGVEAGRQEEGSVVVAGRAHTEMMR
jgi:hypothetical protein